MKILTVISLIIPFISALTDFKNGTILSCPRESILQLNSTGNVKCGMWNVNSTTNVSKIEMILTKIHDNCGPDSALSYTLTMINNPDNGTKILKIEFKNITWMTGGNYMLAVKMENVTEQQKIEIKIADIPAIPDAAKLNFTTVLNFASNLFAVEATVPRKHKCEFQFQTSYIAKYKLFGCISEETKLVSGNLNCLATNDTDNVDKDLVCVASVEGQTLDICTMKDIKDCQLQINLQAVNKLGSTQLDVKTPRLKYTVPAMEANSLKCTASSKKLKLSWFKPCYYLDYEYRIKYGKVNQTMQRTSWITSPYLLTGLTPYTNYKICIEAWNSDNRATKCIIRRTSEDVPSKGPTILNTNIIDEGKENPRWDLAIFWKVPEKQYWRGKPYLMIEHKETKTPEKPVKTGKLNMETTNFTLKGLFKDREYLVRIFICTAKGCNHSSWKNVEFLGAKKSQDIVLYVVIPISVVLVIFCGVCAVFWCKKQELKYGQLKNGPLTQYMDGPTVDTPVRPRDDTVYEVPSIRSTEYDPPPPFGGRVEDLASTESEPEHRLDTGKLQFGGDFGTESIEETELERV